jgi:hypothetical protein
LQGLVFNYNSSDLCLLTSASWAAGIMHVSLNLQRKLLNEFLA